MKQRRTFLGWWALSTALCAVGCGGSDGGAGADGGTADVASPQDLGATDAGPADTGPADAGPADAGPADAGPSDVPMDAGPADVPMDTGPADVPMDTGPADVGHDTGPEASVDVPPACPSGQTRCGGACVALADDPAHCGACDMACTVGANATATCANGVCGARCTAGFANCDGMDANGCEVDTRTSTAHCGACGAGCAAGDNATATCAMSVCGLQCAADFGNCDAMSANGCESDLRTSAQHCGACGRACATGQVCRASACVTPRTAALGYMPAAGTVHLYSAGANALRFTLVTDGGQTVTPSPVSFSTTGGSTSVAISAAGLLRIDGDAPFVAWLHDNSNTDQLEAAGALDGAPLGTELYAFARSAVTVFTGSAAPSAVRVQRVLAAGAVEEIGTWTAPGAGQHRVFPLASVAGVYRIVATGAPVTAMGQSLLETYNHAGYVPAASGGWVGTTFRYAEPAGAGGQRRLVVQSLGPSGSVTFTVNGADTVQGLTPPVGLASQLVAADTLITATTTTPSIAWLEADPGAGCDGTLSDADFVPSLSGGTLGREWVFRTHIAPHGCFLTRRSDIDVIAHTDGTLVEAFDVGATTPIARATLMRGQRLRVLTDAAPNRPLRITASEPALVQHSHADFDFLLRAPSVTVFD